MPHLESLELESYKSESNLNFNDEVCFKNVKVLTLHRKYCTNPRIIRFPNLIELYADFIQSLPNFNLLKQTKTLKKIHIHIGCVDYEQLQTLMLAHSNLTEIVLKLCEDVTDSHIVEFLEKNQQMEKFELSKDKSMKSAAEIIRKQFANKWNVVEFESRNDGKPARNYKFELLIESKH